MVTYDRGPVAWCCAHYPATCPAHGFADNEPAAYIVTWAHWTGVHQ